MQSPLKSGPGLARIVNAIRCAVQGLKDAYEHEHAFRQEIWVAVIAIPLAFILPVAFLSKALMVGSVLLILIVELLNSAIEATVDRISLDRHPLAKQAKDIGSAAVLLSIVNSVMIWALILIERLV